MSTEKRSAEPPTDMRSWLAMIESLRGGAGWSEEELPIEMVQTHISIVLLGRRHVLKLKKPVDFGFLDYTTLEKRRRACESEVTLNRRICQETYIGVQPVAEVNGRPQLSGEGRIIDYGVLMRRLPAERMLDRMLAQGSVTEAIISEVAERLCIFHKGAKRNAEVDVYGSPEVIRRNWDENFAQTEPYINRTISSEAFARIRAWVLDWLESNEGLLRERVRGGWTCDGHGDVRCESVCVTDPICIFDCIEFNERFRCGDVASEVAFLAMDLDARGRPDLGYYFSECYQASCGDEQLFRLLSFYRCYRAYVRGKVLGFRLNESEFSEEERTSEQERARSFFDLAFGYTRQLKRRTVITVGGLSGTGKTTLARSVAGELGLRVVSADAVRKSLFENTGRAAYGEGAYSAEAKLLTYRNLIAAGRDLLERDGGVVLDATFRHAPDRAMAREMAAAAGAEYRLIECRLAPDQIRARLERRVALKEGSSDATWDTYLRQCEEIEEDVDSPPDDHLLIAETSSDLKLLKNLVCDWLRGRDDSSK